MSLAPAAGPGVSVVVPTWDGRRLLERFLPTVLDSAAAFAETTGRPAEVVVSDDASGDDTVAWLARTYPDVRVLSHAERRGFAGNANAGVRAARHDLVYLCNNDVAMHEDTLPPLVAHFMDARVFAVASQVYDLDHGVLAGAGQGAAFRRGFLRIHRRWQVSEAAPEDAPPYVTSYASGGSSLFDRRAFLELGGFDESFAPFGWEDVELSLRAWRLGLEVRFEPQSPVWHRFSSTIGARYAPRDRRTVEERNRLWTHWLHLDGPAWWARHVAFVLLRLLGNVLRGHFEPAVALRQALRRAPEIRARRRALASSHVQCLAQLARRLRAQYRRPEVAPLTTRTAPVRPWPRRTDTPVTEAGGGPAPT